MVHSAGSLYLWCTRGESGRVSVDWLAERGILVAPGDFYGPESGDFVRVGLTATDERHRRRGGVTNRLPRSFALGGREEIPGRPGDDGQGRSSPNCPSTIRGGIFDEQAQSYPCVADGHAASVADSLGPARQGARCCAPNRRRLICRTCLAPNPTDTTIARFADAQATFSLPSDPPQRLYCRWRGPRPSTSAPCGAEQRYRQDRPLPGLLMVQLNPPGVFPVSTEESTRALLTCLR